MHDDPQPIPVSIEPPRASLAPRVPAQAPPATRTEHALPPARRSPATDIYETELGLVIESDLPGASEKTLSIHLDHNVLTLRASTEPVVPPQARMLQQEYGTADFERSFILSDDLDRSRITAELKNGILRICLPRLERLSARVIAVRSTDPPDAPL